MKTNKTPNPFQRYVALAFVLAGLLLAGNSFAAEPIKCEIYYKKKDGSVGLFPNMWFFGIQEGVITFANNEAGQTPKTIKPIDLVDIDLAQPKQYLQAIDLWNAGEYEKAAPLFFAVANANTHIYSMPNNFASDSKFREIECIRRAGKLMAMSDLDFEKKMRLTNKIWLSDRHKEVFDIYNCWRIAGKKRWAQMIAVYKDYDSKMLPAPLRAQLEYLLGQAEEGMIEPTVKAAAEARSDGDKVQARELEAEVGVHRNNAINAFHRAAVADLGESKEIIHDSVVRALKLIKATPDLEDDQTLLQSAHALANVYTKVLVPGSKLPEDVREFLGPYVAPKEDGDE